MPDAVMRQIEMLRMIPKTGKVSPQQLQSRLKGLGYETSERTVQRDLQSLSSVFSLVCDDSSKPHGWKWGKDMVGCDIAGLSIPESLAFRMLQQFSGALLPQTIAEQLRPYFVAAERQLSADIGPRPAGNWARKVRTVAPTQPLLQADVPETVMQAIHCALMHECCLRMHYRSDQAPPYLVHPLGLVQHGAAFYLVVHYDGFSDIRLLAVQRIVDAELTDVPVLVPEGFDLDRYIASGGLGFGEVGVPIDLHLRMYGYAGQHLKETPLSANQVITDIAPGEIEVSATVNLTRRLRWWLLGFGADVEVLGPVALRQEVQAQLDRAAGRYAT